MATFSQTVFDDTVIETGAVVSGEPNASGVVDSTDPDFLDLDGPVAGQYGTFTVTNNHDGTLSWSYVLNEGLADSLTASDLVTDKLTVTSQDGTTVDILVNVQGSNDAAVVTASGSEDNAVGEAGGIANGTAGDATAGGQLSVADVDAGQNSFTTNGVVPGTYGDFNFDSATGVWSYMLDNSRGVTQALTAGQPVTDTLVVATADGTTYNVVVNVSGANDAAVFTTSGTEDNAVVEAGGVANGNPGDSTAGGQLFVTDPDSGQSAFLPAASLNGVFGTFTFDHTTGLWSYTLDNARAATQELAAGAPALDSTVVQSTDGTSYTIFVNLTGTNDAAVVTASGSEDNAVVEAGGLANGTPGDPTAGGQLSVTDVEAGQNSFTTNGNVAGTYGDFAFDSATGVWSYTLDDSRGVTQALTGGQPVTDTLVVATADGTTYNVVVNVTGANDTAVVTPSGSEDNAVVEAGGVANGTGGDGTAGGQLSVADVDSGQNSFTTNGSVAGTYGDFSFNAATGAWSYALDNNRGATQALTAGQPVTDTLTVATADGTTYNVVVNLTGSNDAAVVTPSGSEDNAVVEAGGVANATAGDGTAGGQLSVADVDSGQNSFTTNGTVAGTYGDFSFDAATGAWSYALDNNRGITQALTAGQPVTDTLTVATADGTTYNVVVNITGSNDAAVVTPSGSEDNAVIEAGGVANGTAGDATAGGQLSVADVEAGQNGFVTDGTVVGTYGDFTFSAATGMWSYTLADNRPATQSLVAGQPGTDTLVVQTTDGTTYNVVVNVTGANDTPALAVIATRTFTDTAGDDSFTAFSDTLVPTDPDAGENLTYTLIEGSADNSLAGYDQSAGTGYGRLYLNGLTGAYRFVPDDAGIEGLTGTTVATFHFQVADSQNASSVQALDINLNGVNDTAAIAGVFTGSVQEEAAATLTTGGALTVADRDLGESVFQVQASTAGTYGTFSLAANGNWTYSANNGQAAIQQLAAGQTVQDSFTAVSADGSDGQLVTVTITGTNDLPVIGVADLTGAVTEADFPAGNLLDLGFIDFSDVDLTDTHSVSVTALGTPLGTLTPTVTTDTTGTGTGGQVSWSYSVPAASVEYLSAGETRVESFTVTLDDGKGGLVSRQIDVTITGTNDAPVLGTDVAATDEGDAVQIDVLADDSDVDHLDVLTVTDASVFSGGGSVTVAPDGSSITYDPGSFYSYLAGGETATVTIHYTVSDGQGASASSSVEVTVTGGNDVPVILPATEALASLNELADCHASENNFTHGVSGTIYFADADTTDTHSASFVAQGGAYLGTFSLSPVLNQAADSIGWSFSVSDAALNSLAQGEVVRQYYTVTVSDGHGGTVDQVVEVDLVGTNDRAVVSSANVVVQQGDGAAVAGGQLTITDEDNTAEFLPYQSQPGLYGSLTVAANGSWSFVANQAYDLGPNQFLTDVFTVLAADGTPTTVAVTIAGVDRPAVGAQDLFTTAENQAFGAGFNLFADNGSGPDVDPDGPLQISAVNGSVANVGQLIQLASGALLRVNADGSFSYNPNHAFDSLTAASGAANQFGFDSFTYTLAGGSTTTAFVNIIGVNSAQDILAGNGLDNAVTGFSGNDTFLLNQGGSDSANGLGGNDGFFFGGYFDSSDAVDGGEGADTLALQGNIATDLGGVSNVEAILALSGSDTRFGENGASRYDYDLTTTDATVAAGKTLTIQATGLLAGEDMVFDGSAETDGNFRVFAGRGVDDLTGGAGSDGFFFGADGNLTGADHVDGGAGVDSLALRGNYVGGNAVVFQNGSIANVEVLALLSGHTNEFSGVIIPTGYDYDVTTADGNVAAGQRLDVIGARLGSDETMVFNGSAETDGSFRILGGAAGDTLTGGAQADTLYGGLGKDQLNGGAGGDVFFYRSAAESTSTGYDVISGFDYREDRLDMPGGGARAFGQAGSGSLSTASFDADLAAGLNGILGAGQAALFTANAGTLAGHVFAVVDANGVAGYQAGEDFVIELANPVVPIDPMATIIG